MLIALVAVFALSVIGIAGLFALKYWELKHAHIVLPQAHQRADAYAVRLKELMLAARADADQLLPLLLRLARFLVHRFALALARLARAGERQAHRLADLVSYKHRFEKRETRSEFLKKVAEGKSSSELDATRPDGQNG